MDQHSGSAGPPSAVPVAEKVAHAPPEKVEPTGQRPYLKVFGSDIGVLEFELSAAALSIGRGDQADIRLPDKTVSRTHARITCQEGAYMLEDAGSSAGTIVNRKPTERHILSHGDSAQIGPYVLQFRTHRELPGVTTVAARAKSLLHSQFSLLPSTIRLRFRVLQTAPQEIFESGDTLRIGQSGLLIPTEQPPGDCVCLELHLSWSASRSKRYLGEVVGVIEEESLHWMCVKLHTVSREVYQQTLDQGPPGEWVDVLST